MLDAWLNRTREWLSPAEKLLALPEQAFSLAVVNRALHFPQSDFGLVYLWGACGAGKTSLIRHLLRPSSVRRMKSVCAADAEEWSCWLAACDTSGQPTLSSAAIDVIVCEDLQRLHDPRRDDDRFARWIDEVRAEGIPVIVTSDRLPSQIEGLSPRLASRLRGGLMAGIRPLGEESQKRLTRYWSAGNRQLASNPALIPALPLTAGQLKAQLNRFNLAPAAVMAPEGSLDSAENSLDLIAEAVARDFHISLTELCSGSRTQQLKVPRGVAMSLARELTPCSLLKIGQYFGCRSHSSVVRGCSRLQELLPDAPTLREQVQLLRAKLRHNLSADCG